MLKLVEWRVELLVDGDEFLLESFKFAFILDLTVFQSRNFVGEFIQIGLSSFHIFLAFHQKNFLLLVMLFYCLG